MFSAILQSGVSGICIFLLYKFLIHTLGMQKLGLYSVVLSITGTLGIFNAGFSGSLVRYTSIYHSENQPEKAASLIGTIFSSLLIFFSALLFLLITGGRGLLHFLHLGSAESAEFESLLPLASLVFLSGMMGGVFLSALEGFQRAYLKNYLLSAASFSNLILAILLIPVFELKGLFYSYLISNSVVYLLAWGFVRNYLKGRIFIFPLSWNQELFRQTFQYNATFQLISVSSLFNDPLLRMLLVRFGGLPMAGIYELASKLILQVRAILVSLNQSLVPVFAGMDGVEDGKSRIALFMKSYHLNFGLSNLVLALLAAVLPAISIIWLETGQMLFIALSLMLIPGWIVNTMSVPVYFANIGFGQLKPVLYHHLSLGFLVPLLCYFAGLLGLPLGVVFSWSFGLVVCSLPLITDFFSRHKIASNLMLPSGFRWMFLAHAVFIAAWIWIWLSEFSFSLFSGFIFASGGIILYTFAYAKAGFISEVKMLLKK